MYIPKDTVNLKDQKEQRIFLGIQGPPGSGKTTSALTFPNVTVINYDNNLSEFFGENDISEFPIWSHDWCVKYGFPPSKPLKCGQANRKGATIKILQECLKMEEGQTLLLSSWTTMQVAFDIETSLFPKITKDTGEINEFDFWTQKNDWSEEVMSYLVSMKCNVVVEFHEVQERDKKTGQLLTKTQPMMQGKFATRLKVPFSNYFRMLAEGKLDKDGKELGCNYFWQVKGSTDFDHKCNLKIPDEIFKVEPNFKIFAQYAKKISPIIK